MVTLDPKVTALLRERVRSIPDFPKKGILFRDITTVLKDPVALSAAVDELARLYGGMAVNAVVGIESRGFILGAPLAVKLRAGFVPVRKKGKLPAPVRRTEYALEYGTDVIEIHEDAVRAGDRVVMHDDLLATGGTMAAAIRLVESLGAKVIGVCFLIELTFLDGAKNLAPHPVTSLIRYTSES